ncbi:MAG: SRPBCC family protein [Planctomycetes bacterium]|nr:SRPBCC family protein [Planctomycetota bacterium]MCB9904719.1 SRPBCC family protein [Planctomycetota bacterium]
MASTVKLEHQVAAPPDRTFAVFSDLRNAANRVGGIKSLDVLTPGPIGKGTRFKETRVMMGKEATEEMTITDFQPGRSYTTEAASCGCHYKSTLDFLPASNGTRVVFSMTSTPQSFMAKLMSPLMVMMMKGMMKKCMLADFTDLAAVAETDA